MIDAIALLSGGKDSVYATFIAQQQFFNVIATLTIVPSSRESMMFHVPNIMFAPVVSSVMGLRNLTIEISDDEDELDAVINGARRLGAKAIITGAIASDYQSQMINLKCEPFGIKVFSPLWHKNQEMLLREIVSAGFRITIVAASAEGLSEEWLGRIIDLAAIDELKKISVRHGIQIAGEGGEFETLVLDGPNFSKSLEIASARKLWRRDFGALKIYALRLHDKHLC